LKYFWQQAVLVFSWKRRKYVRTTCKES